MIQTETFFKLSIILSVFKKKKIKTNENFMSTWNGKANGTDRLSLYVDYMEEYF